MSDTLTRLAAAAPTASTAGASTVVAHASPQAQSAAAASLRSTAFERRDVRLAQLMIGAAAGGIVAFAATLLHGDLARGSALLLAGTMWTLAALLPLLTGPLKVGALESELRS